MKEIILHNIYHLLLMSEASRLGIIDKETYKDLITKLLKSAYEESEDKE